VRRFVDKHTKRRAVIDDAASRRDLGLVYVATRRTAEEYAVARYGRRDTAPRGQTLSGWKSTVFRRPRPPGTAHR
jgi:hypothetical protein